MLNLSKTVVKGEKLNLVKSDGTKLQNVVMGLGWDEARGSDSIDLDASVVMFDDQKRKIDAVSFQQLRSVDGSVKHSGDNLTGEGAGDDERISVDLNRVPSNVHSMVFVITSYRGHTFDKVENCFCRLFEAKSGEEFNKLKQGEEYLRYTLSEKGNHTGKIMSKLYRHNGEWKFAALGIPCNGRTWQDILTDITDNL